MVKKGNKKREKITVSDGIPKDKDVESFGGKLRTAEEISAMKVLRQEELLLYLREVGFKITKQGLGLLWQLAGVDTDVELVEFIEWYKKRYLVINATDVREFISMRAREQVDPSIQALANKGLVDNE